MAQDRLSTGSSGYANVHTITETLSDLQADIPTLIHSLDHARDTSQGMDPFRAIAADVDLQRWQGYRKTIDTVVDRLEAGGGGARQNEPMGESQR